MYLINRVNNKRIKTPPPSPPPPPPPPPPPRTTQPPPTTTSINNGVNSLQLLKSAEEVTLTVATTSQLPAPVVVAQTYSWVTADGRATSPPPEYNPRLHHHQVSTDGSQEIRS
ncbi:hypothetical protein E2C01_036891 [Portunus trituberculatus]|uniref:Uncharacterized protein n=1 Tax=Portunus trituberculatus TaxID=210409 RepID=A0A5B7FDA2_PORTR|nr:hypothetical protein [Portunus trituberculatus]